MTGWIAAEGTTFGAGGSRRAGEIRRTGGTPSTPGNPGRGSRDGGPAAGRRRGRIGIGGLLATLLLFGAGGCASSGTGGSGNEEDARSLPSQQRMVVRVGGYRAVDIYNEPGVGVRTIDVAAATVWRVVGGVYAQLDIPVEHTNPPVMEIGNRGYRARRVNGDRMNTFVDCGSDLSGPLANRYDITLSVVTRVTAKGEENSEILTTVDAYGRPTAVSGNPIHCQSRGILEQRVAQAIATALGREP